MNPYGQNPKGGPIIMNQPQKKESCGIAEFKDKLERHADAPKYKEIETDPNDIERDKFSEIFEESFQSFLDVNQVIFKAILTIPIKLFKFFYHTLFLRQSSKEKTSKKPKKIYTKS